MSTYCSARAISLPANGTSPSPGSSFARSGYGWSAPKGVMDNVAVLGPVRGKTQAELSATDSRGLGVRAPLRMSGDLDGAADILVTVGDKCVLAASSVIVAKNHIHMTPEDAARYRLANQELVNVRIDSPRPLVFEKVTVRVDRNCSLAMHIDIDEANACLCPDKATGVILR